MRVILGYLVCFLFLFGVAAIPASLIAYFTHVQLVKSGNPKVKRIRNITFFATTLIIMIGIFALVLYSVTLER